MKLYLSQNSIALYTVGGFGFFKTFASCFKTSYAFMGFLLNEMIFYTLSLGFVYLCLFFIQKFNAFFSKLEFIKKTLT